ncbi:MAG: acyltransferase [bacterium]|nr:acyltransferase [bacterium]
MGGGRNAELDVIKIIACCAVICLHYSTAFCGRSIFKGGSVACEVFFMISGYLMMPSIKPENTGIDAVRFIASKLKKIFPLFFASAIIYYILYYCINVEQNTFSLAEEFEKIFWGGIFLSEIGMGVAIGPTWYISAMLIGMFILFPILSKTANNRFFACVYAPIISGLIYAFLKARYGMTQTDTYIMTADSVFIVLPSLMRGLAGLMLGCFIYCISDYYRLNFDGYGCKRKRTFLKLLQFFLALVVFGGLMQKTCWSRWDFVEIFCFVIILLIAGICPYNIKHQGVKEIISYLGRLTLPMYLFQDVSGYIMKILDAKGVHSYLFRTVIFWITLVMMSVIGMYLTQRCTAWRRKL